MREKKKEDASALTPMQESYLACIYEESISHDGLARAHAIANKAGVTRSTVALALRALKERGLIDYDPYGPLRLTEKGLAIGKACFKRRQVLRTFFQTVMKLDESTAQRFAAELESSVDAKSLTRFERFNLFFSAHEKDFSL